MDAVVGAVLSTEHCELIPVPGTLPSHEDCCLGPQGGRGSFQPEPWSVTGRVVPVWGMEIEQESSITAGLLA